MPFIPDREPVKQSGFVPDSRAASTPSFVPDPVTEDDVPGITGRIISHFGVGMAKLGFALYQTPAILAKSEALRAESPVTINIPTRLRDFPKAFVENASLISRIPLVLPRLALSQIAKRTDYDERIAASLDNWLKRQNEGVRGSIITEAPEGTVEIISEVAGGGVGSLALAMGLTYLTKSPTTSAVVFGELAKGQTFEAGIQAGVDPGVMAQVSDTRALWEGSLEFLGLKFLTGKHGGRMRTAAVRLLTEPVQETGQSIGEALVEVPTFDPDRTWEEIMTDIGMSAFAGLFIGGGATSIQSVIESRGMNEVLTAAGIDPASKKGKALKADYLAGIEGAAEAITFESLKPEGMTTEDINALLIEDVEQELGKLDEDTEAAIEKEELQILEQKSKEETLSLEEAKRVVELREDAPDIAEEAVGEAVVTPVEEIAPEVVEEAKVAPAEAEAPLAAKEKIKRKAPTKFERKALGIPTEKKVVTAKQALKFALRKAEITSAKAFLTGQREQVKTVERLREYAVQKLDKEDLQAVRQGIFAARTPSQIKQAQKSIDILAKNKGVQKAKAEFRVAKKALKLNQLGPKERVKAKGLLDFIKESTFARGIIPRLETVLQLHKAALEDGDLIATPEDEVVAAVKILKTQPADMEFKNMDPEAITAVANALKRIKHISDTKKAWQFTRKNVDAQAELAESTDEVVSRHSPKVIAEERVERRPIRNLVSRTLGWGQTSLQTKAHILGGAGSVLKSDNPTTWKILVGRPRQALGISIETEQKAGDAIQPALETHKIDHRWRNQTRDLFIPSTKRTISVTHGEMIDLLGNIEDIQTIEEMQGEKFEGITFRAHKIRKPITLTADDIVSIQGETTEAESAVLDAMRGYINGSERDAINRVWVRDRGYEIATREDRTYWPRWRDKDFIDLEPNKSVKEWGRRYLDQQGQFKSRQRSKRPIIITDAFEKYFIHANHAAAFIGKNAATEDALRLLNDKDFRTAIQEGFTDGNFLLKQMEDAVLKFSGTDAPAKRGTLDTAARMFLRNFQRSALALKPHINAYQGVSYTTALTQMEPKFWKAGLEIAPKNIDQEITENSPMLRARHEGTAHGIITPGLASESLDKRIFGIEPILDKATAGIRGVDWIVMRRIWLGAKAKMGSLGFKGDELLTKTARYAEEIVYETQPTWDALSTSALGLEGRESILARMATMFSSQTNKNFNIAMGAISDYNQSDKTSTDLGKMVKDVGIPIIISGILVEILRRLALWGYSGFQKEFNKEGLIFAFFSRILGNWLVARDVTEIIKTAIDTAQKKPTFLRRPRVNPLTDFFMDINDLAIHVSTAVSTEKDATRKKNIEKAIFATANLISAPAGLPIPGVLQIVRQAWPSKKDKPNGVVRKERPTVVRSERNVVRKKRKTVVR